MNYLVLGLFIFIGVHSVRIVADGWRTRMLASVGAGTYKGVYTVLSLLGFGLVVWGFGVAREAPVVIWTPPAALRHANAALMLVAFVFLAASYVPANAIKARVHHPMVLAVKTWAVAHLLVTTSVAHLVLFGTFLVWSVLLFIASRRRDRLHQVQYAAGTLSGTVATVVVGCAGWALVAFSLHGMLIGIRPLG